MAEKKAKALPGKPGRRSTFTQDFADEICERIGKGEPLAQICREERMPGLVTVYDWMAARPAFAEAIARARIAGFDIIAQDALNIADTPMIGVRRKETEDGIETVTEDMLGHRKLQVETRLKLLAKWDPKRYGERIESNVNANVNMTMTALLGEIEGSHLKPK